MNELSITQGFSETTQQLALAETASTAIAAQAKAMVESRFIVAMRNPRNWDAVRQDVLRECRRPAFANNKSAYYIKPIGPGVEGLGIRFVEVALRCMKNVLVETTMIFEDKTKEIHRVSVTDLEANITYPLDVRVSRVVERSRPSSDGSYISVRKNSYGKDTYTVEATDDDLLNKRGALISKAIRTLGTRIIPGDLCDEAEEIIKKIRLDHASADPEGERKRIVDAFVGIGVSAENLAKYLDQKDLKICTPAQIVELRGIYGAIKDGEATWSTVMENKNNQKKEGSKLDEILKIIADSANHDELKKARSRIKELSGKESEEAKAAWLAKSESMQKSAEPVATENPDWKTLIANCKTISELSELLKTMPEQIRIDLHEDIDGAEYDIEMG